MVAIVGPKEAVHVAVAVAAGCIFPSPITLVLLELSAANGQASAESTGARLWRALRRALGKPIVLAPIAGLILSISGLEPGDVVRASFLLIGQAAGGAALFLTGLILSAQPFRLDRKVVIATTVINVIQPLLVAAIVYVFAAPLNIAKPAILLAALPSGFFGILFGANYKVVSTEAGSIIIASTAVSVVTLAVAIAVLYPQ
jgi:malonate transporter